MWMMNNCPICNKLYSRVDKSLDVCDKHLDWKVTKCVGCGKYVFSDCVGICPDCAPLPNDDDDGIIEQKAMFRELGLKRE